MWNRRQVMNASCVPLPIIMVEEPKTQSIQDHGQAEVIQESFWTTYDYSPEIAPRPDQSIQEQQNSVEFSSFGGGNQARKSGISSNRDIAIYSSDIRNHGPSVKENLCMNNNATDPFVLKGVNIQSPAQDSNCIFMRSRQEASPIKHLSSRAEGAPTGAKDHHDPSAISSETKNKAEVNHCPSYDMDSKGDDKHRSFKTFNKNKQKLGPAQAATAPYPAQVICKRLDKNEQVPRAHMVNISQHATINGITDESIRVPAVDKYDSATDAESSAGDNKLTARLSCGIVMAILHKSDANNGDAAPQLSNPLQGSQDRRHRAGLPGPIQEVSTGTGTTPASLSGEDTATLRVGQQEHRQEVAGTSPPRAWLREAPIAINGVDGTSVSSQQEGLYPMESDCENSRATTMHASSSGERDSARRARTSVQLKVDAGQTQEGLQSTKTLTAQRCKMTASATCNEGVASITAKDLQTSADNHDLGNESESSAGNATSITPPSRGTATARTTYSDADDCDVFVLQSKGKQELNGLAFSRPEDAVPQMSIKLQQHQPPTSAEPCQAWRTPSSSRRPSPSGRRCRTAWRSTRALQALQVSRAGVRRYAGTACGIVRHQRVQEARVQGTALIKSRVRRSCGPRKGLRQEQESSRTRSSILLDKTLRRRRGDELPGEDSRATKDIGTQERHQDDAKRATPSYRPTILSEEGCWSTWPYQRECPLERTGSAGPGPPARLLPQEGGASTGYGEAMVGHLR